MSKIRSASPLTVEHVGYELRSEIRRVLRKHAVLTNPLQMFRQIDGRPEGAPTYQVCFDILPPVPSGDGLRIRTRKMTQPDERVEDAVYDLARAVWHFKDWLGHWARLNGSRWDVAENHAKGCRELSVAADLINTKKHGTTSKGGVQNRSGLYPYINEVHFDTSTSGVIEVWYRGDLKETTLLVTDPNPIPFRVPIWQGDGSWHRLNDRQEDDGECIGDAAAVLMRGFIHWLPLIKSLGVLDDYERNPESSVLRVALGKLSEGSVSSAPATFNSFGAV